MMTPLSVYRECHFRHHAYLNRPDDWELWPYSAPDASLWFRRVFVWFDLIAGVATAPFIYGRIFFSRDSPVDSPTVRQTIKREYLAASCFWGGILAAVSYANLWMIFVWAWLIPYWTAGILQSGRKFTEHLGMASFDPLLGTRTVAGEGWITRLCTFLNFDIFVHGPHHRYPRAPHNRLRGILEREARLAGEPSIPVFANYAQAVRDMLPWMFLNPGVGRNVQRDQSPLRPRHLPQTPLKVGLSDVVD